MVRRRWGILGLLGLLALLVAGSVGYVLQAHERVYSVRTGSMTPYLRPGDAIVVRAAGAYHVGDVVTFRPAPGSSAVVTHRIVSVNGDVIRTKGDANRTQDTWSISSRQIVGVVAHRLPHGGYVLVYFQQPAGIGSAMTAVLALVLLWGLCFPGAGMAEPSPAEELVPTENLATSTAH
jgi:signal peptidase